MRINLVGAFIRNRPFGTEIAFAKGFERLGGHHVTVIDTSYPDQKWDYDADATVVFKWMEGYWQDLRMCGGKKIVYQPDDLRFPHIQEMMRKMRHMCEYAFTFDKDGAKLALEYGYSKAQRLLLTADDELYVPRPELQKDLDVIFVGSMTRGANHAGRWKMWEIVSSIPGIKSHCISDLYDMGNMMEALNRSKIVLNHATDVGQPFGHGYGYQCRHFEAGLTRSCVLSNVVDNERELQHVQEFGSEAELVGKIGYLLANPQVRQSAADGLYSEIVNGHLPQHRAQQMIEFIEAL